MIENIFQKRIQEYDKTAEVGDSLLLQTLEETKLTKEDLRRHLISASITFGSTFLVTLAMAITDSSFSFSREALFALAFSAIIAGVRGVAKLVIEWNSGLSS